MHLMPTTTSSPTTKTTAIFNTPLVPPCQKATDVENFCGGCTTGNHFVGRGRGVKKTCRRHVFSLRSRRLCRRSIHLVFDGTILHRRHVVMPPYETNTDTLSYAVRGDAPQGYLFRFAPLRGHRPLRTTIERTCVGADAHIGPSIASAPSNVGVWGAIRALPVADKAR